MNQQKILVVQTAFLGDAILTLPMIQKLKEKYPESIIHVLCIPSSKDIFINSPFVENVIVYDKRGSDKSTIKFYKLIKRIRGEKYNFIFSPHRSFRTSLIVFLSGVIETYGFNTASMHFIYKHVKEYNRNAHEVIRNLQLLGLDSSIRIENLLPVFRPSHEVDVKLSSMMPNSEKQIIAIAPGSVWNTKIYPKEYFEKIIENLISRGYLVFLIGGKDDRDLCSSILEKFENNLFSFAGRLNPYETIIFLKKVSLLICNDSAPTHLGMAADIPVLTIYCSTIPEFGFYPYNGKSAYLSYDDLKCKPCGIHGKKRCPIKTFDCGYRLTPAIVLEKVNQLITYGHKKG